MSLRSLLPIGRSFEPSGDRLGRFRPAEPGLLPDFSRDSKGAREDRIDNSGPAEVVEAGRILAAASATLGARRATGGGPEILAGVEMNSAGSSDRDPAGVARVGDGRPRRRVKSQPLEGRRLPVWLEQLILALTRSGNRRRGSRPVQDEFCLRTVKVAKNDLVTSDVEVVVRALEKPKALSASCRARLMALWWAPVARRLGRWGHRSLES